MEGSDQIIQCTPFIFLLQVALHETTGYQYGDKHRSRNLKELGFSWNRPKRDRGLLVEITDIVVARIQI